MVLFFRSTCTSSDFVSSFLYRIHFSNVSDEFGQMLGYQNEICLAKLHSQTDRAKKISKVKKKELSAKYSCRLTHCSQLSTGISSDFIEAKKFVKNPNTVNG